MAYQCFMLFYRWDQKNYSKIFIQSMKNILNIPGKHKICFFLCNKNKIKVKINEMSCLL